MADTCDAQVEPFWYNVSPNDESGCWEWSGYKDRGGYGVTKRNGKLQKAHRVSYVLCVGEIPNAHLGVRGVLVLHKCDNRKCVNPAHLFLGNHKDNAVDRVRKGRSATPRRNGLCGSGRHEWCEENIYRRFRNGIEVRECRPCRNETAAKHRRAPNAR